MIRFGQRRELKAIAVLALTIALLLLLLPHTIGPHSPQLIFLALVPVFLFAIVDIPFPQRLPVQADRPAKLAEVEPSVLFQRPPPSRLA